MSGRFPESVFTELVELLIKAHERGAIVTGNTEVSISSWRENKTDQHKSKALYSQAIGNGTRQEVVSEIDRRVITGTASLTERNWALMTSPKGEKDIHIDLDSDYYADIFLNTEPASRRHAKKKSKITIYEVAALSLLLLEVVYIAWKYRAYLFQYHF